LPPSMADAFTQCERTVAMGWAQHLAEQAAQAERSTAARLAALTTETMTYATMLEGTVATLERQLTEVTTEGEALEAARAHADAEIGRLTVALETSGRAQVALDVDCAAQRARTTASEAQLLRAAERAHDAQRGLDAATGELALLAQRLTWVEGTATTLQSALDLQTTRASEAEQARDLATGRLSALEDEIRHLRHPVTAPTLRMTVVD
jgi:chromosome segregation ATPase